MACDNPKYWLLQTDAGLAVFGSREAMGVAIVKLLDRDEPMYSIGAPICEECFQRVQAAAAKAGAKSFTGEWDEMMSNMEHHLDEAKATKTAATPDYSWSRIKH